MGKKIILNLVGPSGSGKSTLADALGFPRVVSHTTRKQRATEINKVDYFFEKSKEDFFKLDLFEYTEYAGNYYGTTYSDIEQTLAKNDIILLITDRKGTEALKAKYGSIVKCIYLISNLDMLVERMKKRGDSREKIGSRLLNIIENHELDVPLECDYILNACDELEDKVKDIKQIVESIQNCYTVLTLAQ